MNDEPTAQDRMHEKTIFILRERYLRAKPGSVKQFQLWNQFASAVKTRSAAQVAWMELEKGLR